MKLELGLKSSLNKNKSPLPHQTALLPLKNPYFELLFLLGTDWTDFLSISEPFEGFRGSTNC